MKEIKLRAIMKKPGVHEGVFVYTSGLNGFWHSRNGTYYGEIIPGSEEQYINRKDISGKLVFEGDRINIIDDGIEYKNLIVKFSEKHCAYIAENEDWCKRFYGVEHIEITGNIHEGE